MACYRWSPPCCCVYRGERKETKLPVVRYSAKKMFAFSAHDENQQRRPDCGQGAIFPRMYKNVECLMGINNCNDTFGRNLEDIT